MNFYIIVLTILLSSCLQDKTKELKFEYKEIGKNNYFPPLKTDMRNGDIIIAFASNFDKDTVNIKYKDIDTTKIITTDEIDGLSWDLRLGKATDKQEIKIKINQFRSNSFTVNSENHLFLITLYDSLLTVNSLYSIGGFD